MKTDFLRKVLAIYDVPDYRRMSIPLPDEAGREADARTYFHPIDFEKTPKMKLGGLDFEFDRSTEHKGHPFWSYKNKKTDICIHFSRNKSKDRKDDPAVPEIAHTKASLLHSIGDDRMIPLTNAIAEDLKKKGYTSVRITGPSTKRVV